MLYSLGTETTSADAIDAMLDKVTPPADRSKKTARVDKSTPPRLRR